MSELPTNESPRTLFPTEVDRLGVLKELYINITTVIRREGLRGEGKRFTITAPLPRDIGPLVTNDYIPPSYTLKVDNEDYEIRVQNVVVRREDLSGQWVSEITANFTYKSAEFIS